MLHMFYSVKTEVDNSSEPVDRSMTNKYIQQFRIATTDSTVRC